MTFDKQAAREVCIKLSLRYPARSLIVDDYQCALAAEMLPAALDRIDELESAPSHLTAEQRAALETVCYLADGYECTYAECAKDQENALSVVRSMLDQSHPAWQITEERIAAIENAADALDDEWNPGRDEDYLYLKEDRILRAMLAEAEGNA
jgi:hypothetical protein